VPRGQTPFFPAAPANRKRKNDPQADLNGGRLDSIGGRAGLKEGYSRVSRPGIINKGSVQNNGKKTYKYVKVRGAFIDRTGKTIDTDWTYAVGSEGLRPGEKSSFRMSVPVFSNFMMAEATIFEAD
jgi:hypothetical protein